MSNALIGQLVKKAVKTVSKLMSDNLANWIQTREQETWLYMDHVAKSWSKDFGVEITPKQIGNCIMDMKRLEAVIGKGKMERLYNVALCSDFLEDDAEIVTNTDDIVVGGPEEPTMEGIETPEED